ncbi:MAG: aldo/keto reductase [Marinobacter sp.]|uniref:aldo/keto reductase n=1 Tax=Marinobacter sp. TaxID=50741 RepID=UPI003F9AB9E1
MISRRTYLKLAMAAGVGLAMRPSLLWAQDRPLELITRTIPSSGERLPGVGLGSSATFSSTARSEDLDALREVFAALVKEGGSVFDTAPGYGASEKVAGQIANELEIVDKLFWATKLNVAGRGGTADLDEARAQLERSFERIGKKPIDLIQVHNMADIPNQLGLLKELREEKRVRYIGVTTTFSRQYDGLEKVMKREPIDFIGIDYAVDNLTMEERILPMARDKGIAVLVYAPFGRTRLWDRVKGKELPDWAAEFDTQSWAQFFLKFVLSHPVVTATTPATSKALHMIDNMGGAMGALPDEVLRKRMVAYIEGL